GGAPLLAAVGRERRAGGAGTRPVPRAGPAGAAGAGVDRRRGAAEGERGGEGAAAGGEGTARRPAEAAPGRESPQAESDHRQAGPPDSAAAANPPPRPPARAREGRRSARGRGEPA